MPTTKVAGGKRPGRSGARRTSRDQERLARRRAIALARRCGLDPGLVIKGYRGPGRRKSTLEQLREDRAELEAIDQVLTEKGFGEPATMHLAVRPGRGKRLRKVRVVAPVDPPVMRHMASKEYQRDYLKDRMRRTWEEGANVPKRKKSTGSTGRGGKRRKANHGTLGHDVDQLRVQLAGCGAAALGGTRDIAVRGDYGWSPAYQSVLDLRLKYDRRYCRENHAVCQDCDARPGEKGESAMNAAMRRALETPSEIRGWPAGEKIANKGAAETKVTSGGQACPDENGKDTVELANGARIETFNAGPEDFLRAASTQRRQVERLLHQVHLRGCACLMTARTMNEAPRTLPACKDLRALLAMEIFQPVKLA